MKIVSQAVRIGLSVLALVASVAAQEARFFRMAGPAPTVITALTPEGYMTWLTLQPGTNYTVQTARSFAGASNWVDYVQVPTTNWFTTNRRKREARAAVAIFGGARTGARTFLSATVCVLAWAA